MTEQEILDFTHEGLIEDPNDIIFSECGINKDYIRMTKRATTKSGEDIIIELRSYYSPGNWIVIKVSQEITNNKEYGFVSTESELRNIIDEILEV